MSIRSRLPLTYAGIALLTALALSAMLLITLRRYYQEQERRALEGNARQISVALGRTLGRDTRDGAPTARALALLAQARVKLFDVNGVLLADSGPAHPRTALAVRVTQPMNGGIVGDSSTGVAGKDRDVDMMVLSSPGTDSLDIAQVAPATRIEISGMLRARDVLTHSSLVYIHHSPFGFDLAADGTPGDQQARGFESVQTEVRDDRGKLLGTVVLSDGPAFGRDIVAAVARAAAFAGLLAVVLAAAVGWWVSRGLSTPLLALTRVTERMASGDLSVRANVALSDELGQLAGAFNRMAQRVEDTVTQLRQFVADAAHELNTPLTALRANLELAVGAPAGKTGTYLARGLAQTERMQQLSSGLLDLSRLDALPAGGAAWGRVDLTRLVRALGELHASRAEQAGVQFTLEASESVSVRGDEARLAQAIGNVLDNALKFTASGGAVALRLSSRQGRAQLTVSDTGIGIPPDDLPHIFERFHRGRNANTYTGSGLGLAITDAIVRQHGGALYAQPAAEGTTITLEFPLEAGDG